MDRWKAEQGRGREKRKISRKKSRRERVRRKKMQMREKVGKLRNTVFFQWFVVPEGRKVGSLKRRVRGQLARWEMKNCTPLWREAHFEVKMYKTHHCVGPLLEVAMSKKCTPLRREAHFQVKMYKTQNSRTTFGSCDVERVHAVVARSIFPSQNVQKPLLEVAMSKKCTPLWREAHFHIKMYKTHHLRTTFGSWDVEKSAPRCGAKHISTSKCTKHTTFGPLLEVAMSKKCTPLWREAHFHIKMYKTHHLRTTFGSWDVEKVHPVVARSTFPHQNVQNTPPSDHFWKLRCRKSARRCGAKHISKSECTKHHMFAPHLEVQMSLRFASLHYITLHYTTLHYITLHSTTLHYITLHYLPLHFTTLHYTTLHYTTTTTTTTQVHSTTLNYTTLHYITLHYTTFHYTPLHYNTLHYTTLHWMTLHHR